MADAQVVKRYPVFDIHFYTEDDDYHVTYDSRDDFSKESLEQSVIQLSTKNAMEDDSATFTFVLAGDVYWDRLIQANDAVILKINPSEDMEEPENPVLLVGMVSEVRLEGDYGENSKMYRITGQSFAKALINFEIGVIQEVSVNLTDIGWLPNEESEDNDTGGIQMEGRNASQLAETVMGRFLEYMKYSYKGGGIDQFLEWEFDSWVDDENLIDSTPFINYEGSLKQMLDDITAKPFNELFFDATKNEKCRMIMRRAPFDQNDWNNLPLYQVTSKNVISESVATTDTETYTIFNVAIASMLGLNSSDLGSKPRYFSELLDKFGYKKLEVENRYLMDSVSNSDDAEETDDDDSEDSDDDSDEEDDPENTFNEIYTLVIGKLLGNTKNRVRVNKNSIATSISKLDNRLTKNQGIEICDYYAQHGNLPQDQFSRITGINKDNGNKGQGTRRPNYKAVTNFLGENTQEDEGVTSTKGRLLDEFIMSDSQANSLASSWEQQGEIASAQYKEVMEGDEEITAPKDPDGAKLQEFTERLANWYVENPNFYSGEVVVKGSPDFRLGGRLYLQDEQNDEIWEYYIESVQHSYSYTEGYTTTLGVTRGLQNAGRGRFTNLWGKSEEFKGGYLGELALQELTEKQDEMNEDEGDDEDDEDDDE
ncbi:MAG: hypothetical protein L0I72_02535 [Tetragenococcus halophilus]|nr:hypothetical protein [Tetragenococcus halophilus]MDN6344951.1 hypothetical protein [Tetragenococcus koreensis]